MTIDPAAPGGRARRVLAQVVFLAGLAAVVAWLGRNLAANLTALGLDTSYGFLRQPAGFQISGSTFEGSGTVLEALLVGARNTVLVSAAGIVLATLLGLVVGVARLSPNRLTRRVGALYVETFRNVPVLVTIVFMYEAVALRLPPIEEALRPLGAAVVSNRGIWVPWPAPARGAGLLWGTVAAGLALAAVAGSVLGRRGVRRRWLWVGSVVAVGVAGGWVASGAGLSVPRASGRSVVGGLRLQAEFAALLAGLVLYTSSHIGEVVRASILAVSRGQSEAAEALGLSSFQRLRLIVVPQALRIMVPPLANQYLNLTKNSSLGVAVAFAELTFVTRTATGNGSPAPQAVSVAMAIYLALSLAIAGVTNLLNRRLLAAWR